MTPPHRAPGPDDGSTSVVVARPDAPEPLARERLFLHVFDREASWKHTLADEGETIVGRGGAATLRLSDASVSRAHARIVAGGRRVSIVDLGSANGVAVNGVRIAGARFLSPRDIVTLGRSTLILGRHEGAGRVLALEDLERRAAALLERARAGGRASSLVLVRFHGAPPPLEAEPWDVAWTPGGELLALLPDVGRDAVRAATDRLVDGFEAPAPIEAAHVTAPEDGLELPGLLERLRAALAERDPARVTAGTVHHLALGDRTIIVADPAMARLYDLLRRLAPAELPVLLDGETGAGKEAAARWLHVASPRAAMPFVALNCAALPEQLAESELFGYEKGSFSGAAGSRAGLLESAAGGTVFLDEVGELSLAMQAKLLRALDGKVTRRLGDVRERSLDIRVVSATNRDLQAEVGAGRFRADLYFRLSAASVRIVPLRERPREVALLARAFLDEACARRGRPPLQLAPSAIAALGAHSWPGNVRELKNLCDYVAAVAPGGVLEAADLPVATTLAPAAGPPVTTATTTGEHPPAAALKQEVRELERRRMLEALQLCGGNQSRAAAMIKMPRRTFVAKVKAYGLKVPTASA